MVCLTIVSTVQVVFPQMKSTLTTMAMWSASLIVHLELSTPTSHWWVQTVLREIPTSIQMRRQFVMVSTTTVHHGEIPMSTLIESASVMT